MRTKSILSKYNKLLQAIFRKQQYTCPCKATLRLINMNQSTSMILEVINYTAIEL